MGLISDVWARDTARLVSAGSALAVGAAGWLLAHTVTLWLIAHSHHGTLSLSARPAHSSAAAAAVVAGCLAGASLLSVVLIVGLARDSASRSARRRRTTFQLAVGVSTVAFLAADAVEHAVLGLEGASPVLVLFGACLHALVGAGSSLFWLRFTDTVHTILAPLRPLAAAPVHRLGRPARRSGRRRLLWAEAAAGRAPPIG